MQIPREQAAALGQSALAASTAGTYNNAAGQPVDWGAAAAVAAKRSLPLKTILPMPVLKGPGSKSFPANGRAIP